MSIFAVIPVKTLLKSKTRLSQILKPQERQILTLTMLEDVSNALKDTPKIERIIIISSDVTVQEFASNHGATFLLEEEEGLNQAIDQAVRWCIKNYAESVLVLPADISLVTSYDVNRIVELGSENMSVVISPSHDCGTNALLQKPPNLITPLFGTRSFIRHIAEASEKGIMAKVYYSHNLVMDIDSPEDLENLLKIEKGTLSHRFLSQIGLDIRLKNT